MGLFNRSKLVVGSSAVHMADAGVDPVKDAVITAVLTGGVPVVSQKNTTQHLIKSNLNGMALKVEHAFKYAQANYKLGLPSGETFYTDAVSNATIATYIAAELPHPDGVLVTAHQYLQYIPAITIYDFLLQTRDYNPATTQIGTWPAGVTFTSHWGEDISGLNKKMLIDKITLNADKVSVDIKYELWIEREFVDERHENITVTKDWIKDPKTFTENVAIPNADSNQIWGDDCLFATYYLLDSGGQIQGQETSWIYEFADNLYPELHQNITAQADTFMPVVPLRYKNQDMTDEDTQNSPPSETNLYSTSKELVHRLGLSLDRLGEKINSNPDVDDIDHAYLMFGVDLQTTFVPSIAYLTEFFAGIAALQNTSELNFLSALANPAVLDEPTNTYNVNPTGRIYRDAGAFTEHGLVLDLEYDYITTQSVSGVIGDGKIGNATKTFAPYTVTIHTTRHSGGEEYEHIESETRHKVILRKQVGDNLLKVVVVHNLRVHNWVYGDLMVTTSLTDIVGDADNHNLIVPIQHNLVSTFTLPERNVIYADALMMVANAIDKVKLKWYETGIFKVVIMVVVMIIVAWTGQVWLGKLAAAATKGVIAVLQLLATSVVVGLVVDMVFDWVIQKFGAELGVIGAIVLSIGAAIGGRLEALGMIAEFTMTTAQYMIQGASALISSANEFLLEEAEKDRNEYAEFVGESEKAFAELQDVEELLKNKSDMDPLTFVAPNRFKILRNEEPSQFFTRCLGLPSNTMFTIHDDIPNFIDSRLSLNKDFTTLLQTSS